MTVIDEPLLEIFRRKTCCEHCRRRTPNGADPHHVFSRGAGRLDIAINLVALCRWCHNAAHAGGITRAKLLQLVATRERITPEEITEIVHEFRRKEKKS